MSEFSFERAVCGERLWGYYMNSEDYKSDLYNDILVNFARKNLSKTSLEYFQKVYSAVIEEAPYGSKECDNTNCNLFALNECRLCGKHFCDRCIVVDSDKKKYCRDCYRYFIVGRR